MFSDNIVKRSPCGALFTAAPPEDLRTDPKATPEARATAAIIKYQGATPLNRFAAIQKNYGHPIPRTRIWTLCQEMGAHTEPVMTSLIAFAAQGTVRTGMYTTGVVSQVGEHKIYLFFSSRHAMKYFLDHYSELTLFLGSLAYRFPIANVTLPEKSSSTIWSFFRMNEAKVREAPELWYPWNYQI